jgi:MFS family permease
MQAERNGKFPAEENTMVKFVIVWAGQLISLVGSGLTSFALGIWVFQRNRSITEFALLSVFVTLPGILISPFAGVIIDRVNRRTVMLYSDLAAGAGTLALVLLFFAGSLHLWEIYLLITIGSLARGFRFPAFLALLSQLVPARHIGRASGMMQLAPGVAFVFSPLLAAALLSPIGLSGVILVDVTTFVFAIVVLLLVPTPTLAKDHTSGTEGSIWKNVALGWRYIAARPGLRSLLGFFALINITNSFSQVLTTPMVLGFADAKTLADIVSLAALGVLAGGILVSIWGGPKHRVLGMLGFALFYGVGIILTGVRPSAHVISLGMFAMAFIMPILNSCSQAIWQSRTEPALQGRIFGIRMTIAWLANPIAFFSAGFLADHVFEPLLAVRGPLAGTWIAVIGTGPGRGAALFLILNGVVALAGTIAFFTNRSLLHLDDREESIWTPQQSAINAS